MTRNIGGAYARQLHRNTGHAPNKFASFENADVTG